MESYQEGLVQANEESDSSSDDDVVATRSITSHKRQSDHFSLSDSSESGIPVGFNRQRKRVKLATSSEENDFGESSDSESIREGARSNPCTSPVNTRPESPPAVQSEKDSISDSEEFEDPVSKSSIDEGLKTLPDERLLDVCLLLNREHNYFISSNSDEESEKCPICLVQFGSQEVGVPVTCNHHFCSVCIQEWAKNSNTCPVDRILFNSIKVLSEEGDRVIREVQVETAAESAVDDDEDFWEGLRTLRNIYHQYGSESLMDVLEFIFRASYNERINRSLIG